MLMQRPAHVRMRVATVAAGTAAAADAMAVAAQAKNICEKTRIRNIM